MLSHISQPPPPNTFRERVQQYRRRHSISQQSSPERQRHGLSARRSLDLPLDGTKPSHDEPVPQIPRALIAERHHAHQQQQSRRQGQPASHSRDSAPPGLNQSTRAVTHNKKPDHVPPSRVKRRDQRFDHPPQTSSVASQQAGLIIQRRAISAECDRIIGNRNIAAASLPTRANEGRIGHEAPFIATTV